MTIKGNGLEEENINFLLSWGSEAQGIGVRIWTEWQEERGFYFKGKIKFAALAVKFENITFTQFSWQYYTSHIKLNFLPSSLLYYLFIYLLEIVSSLTMKYVTF